MTKRDGMTKAQRLLLKMAMIFDGTCHVSLDQRRDAVVLEARGLVTSNGKYLDPKISITPAGRAALANAKKRQSPSTTTARRCVKIASWSGR